MIFWALRIENSLADPEYPDEYYRSGVSRHSPLAHSPPWRWSRLRPSWSPPSSRSSPLRQSPGEMAGVFIYPVVVFQSHLKQIVDAGFDVNVVAAPMSIDSIRHLHRPGLWGRHIIGRTEPQNVETNFHFLLANILGWESCYMSRSFLAV